MTSSKLYRVDRGNLRISTAVIHVAVRYLCTDGSETHRSTPTILTACVHTCKQCLLLCVPWTHKTELNRLNHPTTELPWPR